MPDFPPAPVGLTPGYFIDATDDGGIEDRPMPVYGRDLKESPPLTQEQCQQLTDPEYRRQHDLGPLPTFRIG